MARKPPPDTEKKHQQNIAQRAQTPANPELQAAINASKGQPVRGVPSVSRRELGTLTPGQQPRDNPGLQAQIKAGPQYTGGKNVSQKELSELSSFRALNDYSNNTQSSLPRQRSETQAAANQANTGVKDASRSQSSAPPNPFRPRDQQHQENIAQRSRSNPEIQATSTAAPAQAQANTKHSAEMARHQQHTEKQRSDVKNDLDRDGQGKSGHNTEKSLSKDKGQSKEKSQDKGKDKDYER